VKEITLNQSQIDLLVDHSMKSGTNESCAMLLGIHNEQQWNVKEIFLTRNADGDSETNFTIAPEELLYGYKLADEKHLELVGVFHSHPNSVASPSNTDKKFMVLNSKIPWIIFSGLNRDLKAFIVDEDMEEVAIRII
jgi:proteasome lid subunit RPN8/RPN11